MRICFISLGTFTHIGAYLDYFRQAGHDVIFLSLSPSPERGVPTYNVGFGTRYSETSGKWKYPISMIRARKLLKQLKPDIVHAHYATSAGLAALVCGFHPTVVTAHGSDLITGIKSGIWRPLLRRIFEHADCVNVVSQDLAQMVVSLGISPSKVETLTLGIDTDKFTFPERRPLDPSRGLKLVCTRRLEPVFDHQTIISALALLNEKQINFNMTIVGDGSTLDALQQRVHAAGLDGCVSFTGKVPNDELPEILRRHDVYLSASLWDGTSLSLLEAMATGLFPIVSDIKANAAWLTHNADGLLHKVGDARDLANCIMQICSNPALAVNAASRNREKVVRLASRKTNMKRLEEIYQELIEKQR
jgi:glycosyltransferase involved in cell wall biosynthesis